MRQNIDPQRLFMAKKRDLMRAIRVNDHDSVTFLLQEFPDLRHAPFDDIDSTPLHLVCCCPDADTVMAEILIGQDKKVFLNSRDDTPLNTACNMTRPDLVSFFIDHDYPIYHRGSSGKTVEEHVYENPFLGTYAVLQSLDNFRSRQQEANTGQLKDFPNTVSEKKNEKVDAKEKKKNDILNSFRRNHKKMDPFTGENYLGYKIYRGPESETVKKSEENELQENKRRVEVADTIKYLITEIERRDEEEKEKTKRIKRLEKFMKTILDPVISDAVEKAQEKELEEIKRRGQVEKTIKSLITEIEKTDEAEKQKIAAEEKRRLEQAHQTPTLEEPKVTEIKSGEDSKSFAEDAKNTKKTKRKPLKKKKQAVTKEEDVYDDIILEELKHLAAFFGTKMDFGEEPNLNLNAKDKDGNALIHHIALHCDNAQYLKFLDRFVSKGADVNLPGSNGKTPLIIACQGCKMVEGPKLLLELGADVNCKDDLGSTALHNAVSPKLVEFLLQKIDINVADNSGSTPYHMACLRGDETIINLLLEKGADFGLENNEGKSGADLIKDPNLKNRVVTAQVNIKISRYSEEKPDSETEELTQDERKALDLKGLQIIAANFRAKINFGGIPDIDVNAQSKSGYTLLHHLIVKYDDPEHHTAIKLLVEVGEKNKNRLDVNLPAPSGNTPLHLACWKCDTAGGANFLLDHGADMSIKNNDGNTPYHMACINGKEDIIDLLLEKGADFKVLNKQGKSGLQLIDINKNKDLKRSVLTKQIERQKADNEKDPTQLELKDPSNSVEEKNQTQLEPVEIQKDPTQLKPESNFKPVIEAVALKQDAKTLKEGVESSLS